MPVTIQDAGVCKKKLAFEIPEEEIQAKIAKTLDEVTKEAQIPGFRPGHAPRRLVQRKLRDEIKDQVKNELIAETYKKCVDENKLEILREEDFDPAKIELPDTGPLKFEVEVEVKPQIDLPDYSAIAVEVAKPAVTPADMDAALANLRRRRGRFVEQPKDTPAAEKDMLTADVKVTVGQEVLLEQTDAGVPVFPQALAGIHLGTLVAELTGKKVGDNVKFKVTVPADHENEAARGQEAEVAIAVKGVRRIDLPPLDDEFAKSVGFESVAEVEKAVRERLEAEAADGFESGKREAVATWLLAHVPLEIPLGVAESNAGRVFNQQVVNLQRQGVPVSEIEAKAEALMEACRQRAQRDLKLEFVLGAIAKKENIETTEDEVQARVAMIAEQYHRPADRLYEDMQRQGHLDALRDQVRDEKVYKFLLGKAVITEVAPKAPEAAAPPPAAEAKPNKAKAKAETKAETKTESKTETKAEAKTEGEAAPKPVKKRKSPKAKKSGEAADQETT
jgi:trigger factor